LAANLAATPAFFAPHFPVTRHFTPANLPASIVLVFMSSALSFATQTFLANPRLTVYPIAVNAAVTRATTFGHMPVSGTTPLAIARPTNVAPAVSQNSLVR